MNVQLADDNNDNSYYVREIWKPRCAQRPLCAGDAHAGYRIVVVVASQQRSDILAPIEMNHGRDTISTTVCYAPRYPDADACASRDCRYTCRPCPNRTIRSSMLINTFLDTEDFVHLYYPEDEPPASAAAQGCGAGARMASKYANRPPSPAPAPRYDQVRRCQTWLSVLAADARVDRN
ncbi:hypothetical protein EVAR_102708_1 [Eumeta japonica]|uniref:Uncharacterized protein n=1 Tax=Eumeta variegata TaxID=151549 RepID=A0A4C1TK95_EUMVA|nr:hypothetical protein EVAR_102708_1 [Eumeta japonica]